MHSCRAQCRPRRPLQPTRAPRISDIVDRDGKLSLRFHGRMLHIGIGAEHARTPVLKLVDGLHIRIINATTGELLRELTLDPSRVYQPLERPPGPKPRTTKPDPDPGSGLSGSLERSHGGA